MILFDGDQRCKQNELFEWINNRLGTNQNVLQLLYERLDIVPRHIGSVFTVTCCRPVVFFAAVCKSAHDLLRRLIYSAHPHVQAESSLKGFILNEKRSWIANCTPL